MILDYENLRIQDYFEISVLRDESETTDYETDISETTDYGSNISDYESNISDYELNISDYESKIQDELEVTVQKNFCKFKAKLFFNLINFWIIIFFDRTQIFF